MKIRYLGHSSFLLTTDGGTRIVTDPYGGVGFPFPYVTADLVTVSHGHFDHNRVAAVGGSPAVFDRAGKLEFGDVKLESFRHFHDDVQGKKRGEDLVFRMEADGLVLVHMGDIGEPFAPSIVEELGHVDILCIPVGGNYTVDAAGAKEYVDALSPAAVIPMHYRTPGLTIDVGPIDDFTKLFPPHIIRRAGTSLEFHASSFKQAFLQIYIMRKE